MTWSIIARDSATGQFGIAVATRFFAVGARVSHIAAGFGAVATQALVNPYYGIDGLKLLREGRKPRDIVETLIAGDSGRESRQLHVMDAGGRIAAHTGRECIGWCGHIKGDAFSRQRAGRHRKYLRRERTAAIRATADRRDAIGRSRRRRQARQAIGGASDLWRGGMV
jgi:uncharacterized Ntn-hydrolase superfamily protein